MSQSGNQTSCTEAGDKIVDKVKIKLRLHIIHVCVKVRFKVASTWFVSRHKAVNFRLQS